MKLVLTGLYLVCVANTLKCIQTDNEDATECLDGSDTCRQPIFVNYTGFAKGSYNCGKCEADIKEAGLCTECDTDGCNIPAEVGLNFECYNYAWNNDKEWIQQTNCTTCHRLKNTAVKCNMPGTAADADYSFPHNGCGPCADDAANNTCVECDTEKCNKESSATIFTATLLPLIAVIYSLVM